MYRFFRPLLSGLISLSFMAYSQMESDVKIYDPTLSDVTVPGSSVLTLFEDSLIYSEYQLDSGYRVKQVKSSLFLFRIIPGANEIQCWQKVRLERHNLSLIFPDGLLLGIIRDQMKNDGYYHFYNQNLRIAIHADGTIWVYLKAPGESIKIVSYIHADYEVGAGRINSQGRISPESRRVIEGNWLVITDKGAKDSVETTGGFGVYTRPSYAYLMEGGRISKQLPKNYFVKMRRKASENVVELKTFFPSLQTSKDTLCQTNFIVSVLPSKKRDFSMLDQRIQILYPYKYKIDESREPYRASPYFFPTVEELRAWTDVSWQSYNNEIESKGLHYYDVFENVPLPVNVIVLFEDIWVYASENNSKNRNHKIASRHHAYIPYTTPRQYKDSRLNKIVESETILKGFLKLVAQMAPQVKVLLYISALSDYCQLPYNQSEDEYYNQFFREIKRLVARYDEDKIGGFYIDTLPLDGKVGQLEPMILSYRIMRDLKRLYPDKLIYLHSSENPIGPSRIYTSELRRQKFSLCRSQFIQFEMYAPFIDRYADIILRGEAYPINIKIKKRAIKNDISDHIKYVVNPVGKSNSVGIFKWSRTGRPFTDPCVEDHRVGYFHSYYPVSLRDSRISDWYYFRTQESDEADKLINKLMIMNAVLDNYVKPGYLIVGSVGNPVLLTASASYERRMLFAWPGPRQDSKQVQYGNGFGPFNDYYRAVPVAWKYSLQAYQKYQK